MSQCYIKRNDLWVSFHGIETKENQWYTVYCNQTPSNHTSIVTVISLTHFTCTCKLTKTQYLQAWEPQTYYSILYKWFSNHTNFISLWLSLIFPQIFHLVDLFWQFTVILNFYDITFFLWKWISRTSSAQWYVITH